MGFCQVGLYGVRVNSLLTLVDGGLCSLYKKTIIHTKVLSKQGDNYSFVCYVRAILHEMWQLVQ